MPPYPALRQLLGGGGEDHCAPETCRDPRAGVRQAVILSRGFGVCFIDLPENKPEEPAVIDRQILRRIVTQVGLC